MQESKKKPIMIGVIVVCLAAAAVITYTTIKPDRYNFDEFKDKMIWVMCRNPACDAEYQISLKDYFEYVEEHRGPGLSPVPGLICKKCGEDSVYEVVKCENCGLVFEKGAKPGDYEDKCPRCGYSKIEKDRERAASGG